MGYRDIINSLEPLSYSKYKDITSYEKLMIYAIMILERKKVPLTFNYICIATYKIFPDRFCFDEEFKEYPSGDRLNRTLMHLKYVKNGKPCVAGSVKTGYTLTKLGYSVAEEVENIINNTKQDDKIKAPVVDQHKKGYGKDYIAFISGNGYKQYLETGFFDEMYVWEFYKITPYTQMKRTKENLKDVLEYAKEKDDKECQSFIEKILKLF